MGLFTLKDWIEDIFTLIGRFPNFSQFVNLLFNVSI